MSKIKGLILISFCLLLFSNSLAQELNEVTLTQEPSIESIKEHIKNEEYLTALDEIKSLPEDNDSKILKAKVYYEMHMFSDAKKALENTSGAEAEELNYFIKREDGFLFYPNYTFFNQEVDNQYDLDFQRFGLYLSENGPNNSNFYVDYGIYTFNSGGEYHETNVTNELIAGVHCQPNEKFEYEMNIGGKFFQFNQGQMLLTNSWMKYYPNDKVNWKLGFQRDNVMQTYISAVGLYVNNQFYGQAADNKVYLEGSFKLPYGIKAKIKSSCGMIFAQNITRNQYIDLLVRLEKRIYDNPKNKFIQKIDVGITSDSSTFQYNLLNLFTQNGISYGGYFSPAFFNGTVANLKIEGENNKIGIRYGLKAFVGEQISRNTDFFGLAWGYAPFIEYNINDHIAINVSYLYSKYFAAQRHILSVSTIIRGFKKKTN